MLEFAGWSVTDTLEAGSASGLAVREFRIGSLVADYALIVEGRLVGLVEVKGGSLPAQVVNRQAQRLVAEVTSARLDISVTGQGVPFLYVSNGNETVFISGGDAEASRDVFSFHRPETLLRWVSEVSLADRLGELPPAGLESLRSHQAAGIRNLESSLRAGHRRALLAIATGGGRLQLAAAETYRLIRSAGVRRVLFLVDRRERANHVHGVLSDFKTNDGRRLSDHFSMQILESNSIDPATQIVICTLQRLLRLLERRPERTLPEERRGQDLNELVTYQPDLPIEFFDLVWTDEAHRAVFGLWGQVLDYFDAPIVGLTATPTRELAAYFDGNTVMQVGIQELVAPGIVDEAALRGLWIRAVEHDEPQQLVRSLQEGDIHLGWRELAVLLERVAPRGLLAPAPLLLDFLADYLQDRGAEWLVDPAVTSPPLLVALVQAKAAKRAIGFSQSADVLRVANALRGDERLNWMLSDWPSSGGTPQPERPGLIVCFPPLRGGRQHATVQIADGLTVEVRDDSANRLVLQAAIELADDGEGIFLVTNAFFRQEAGRVRSLLGALGLHVHAVVSVRDVFKSTAIPLNLVFIRRTPVDRVFLAQLSPQVDRAQLVAQLLRRSRGLVPELGRLVDWETFRSFAQTMAAEQAEALIAESGLNAVPLADVIVEWVQPPRRDDSDFPSRLNAIYLPTFADSIAFASRDELTSKPKGYYQLVLDPTRALAPYVAMLLNSSLGRVLRKAVASGTVHPSISRRGLEQLLLPLPEISVQREVVQAMSLIRALRVELDALNRQLTDQPHEVTHVLGNLRELGQHDPVESFTDTLPFPLASILWRYEADLDEKGKVEHLRHFFHASAAFCTIVMLSAFHSDQALFYAEKQAWFREVRGNLRRSTFGSWTKLGATIAASARRLLNGSSAERTRILVAFAVDELLASTIASERLWEILDAARDVRNEGAHWGIIGAADLSGWHAQLGDLLGNFRELVAPGLRGVHLIRPGRSENIKGVRHYDNVSILQGPNGVFRRTTLQALFEMEGGDVLYLTVPAVSPLPSALKLAPLLHVRSLPHGADHACYFYNSSEGDEAEFVSYHFEAEARIKLSDPEVIRLIGELR